MNDDSAAVSPEVNVGAYCDQNVWPGNTSPILDTLNTLQVVCPTLPSVWVNLLPFSPHCGDDGYAIIDQLEVAQADVDEIEQRYLASGTDAHALIDYSFSALLVNAIVNGDVPPLAEYLTVAASLPFQQLLPCRTHDGIYLGSPNLEHSGIDLVRLASVGASLGELGTFAAEHLYELNDSFPMYFKANSGNDLMWSAIKLSVAMTLLAHGIAYFYLPALLGIVPEDVRRLQGRGGNRLRIPGEYMESVEKSGRLNQIRGLIESIVNAGMSTSVGQETVVEYEVETAGCMIIRSPDIGLSGVFNFSRIGSERSSMLCGETILSQGLGQGRLGPLSFAVVATR